MTEMPPTQEMLDAIKINPLADGGPRELAVSYLFTTLQYFFETYNFHCSLIPSLSLMTAPMMLQWEKRPRSQKLKMRKKQKVLTALQCTSPALRFRKVTLPWMLLKMMAMPLVHQTLELTLQMTKTYACKVCF